MSFTSSSNIANFIYLNTSVMSPCNYFSYNIPELQCRMLMFPPFTRWRGEQAVLHVTSGGFLLQTVSRGSVTCGCSLFSRHIHQFSHRWTSSKTCFLSGLQRGRRSEVHQKTHGHANVHHDQGVLVIHCDMYINSGMCSFVSFI